MTIPMTPDPFAASAECLRVLAHPDRLRMVERLICTRMTVGELADEFELAPAVASGHLRLLQRCGLLRPERDGRTVTYVVAEPCLKKIMTCIIDRFIGPKASEVSK
jgi:ArsR family transcriptional regulator, zinc-responsive transcriptional repressor